MSEQKVTGRAFILKWINSIFAMVDSYVRSFFTSAFCLLQEVAGLDRLGSLDVVVYHLDSVVPD